MVECMWLYRRLRASKCLIYMHHQDSLLVFNFLTRKTAVCSSAVLLWMSTLQVWKNYSQLLSANSLGASDDILQKIRLLRDQSILIEEGSKEDLRENEFSERWEWGVAAGLLHFSILDNGFCSQEEGREMQLRRAEHNPSPPLYLTHSHGALPLPKDETSVASSMLSVMKNRRTNRTVGEASISLVALADCLYAGMAITGEVKTDTGMLPLQMSPSGGARNVFEAYVVANSVIGLERGIYHYSATQHSLESVDSNVPSQLGELVANQDWADDKAAMILLVGYLERLMWKYQDPNAYRVALIEAGHKGQNIALCATLHGLSACPTAALSHEVVSRYLKIDSILHTPIYALTLAKPGAYDFEIKSISSARCH